MRWLLAILLAMCVVHGGVPQATAQTDQARALYDEGKNKFESGDFRGALDLFRQAYAIDPHPVLVYNIARASESLGELEGAIEAFEKYLEMDPKASDRGAVEQRIVTLRRDLEERRALEERARQAEKPAPPVAPPPPPPPEPQSPSPVPWIVAGLGAAGIAVGIGLGVTASSRFDDAVAEPSAELAEDLESDARSLGTGANVAFGVGGAVLLGAVIAGIVDLVAVGNANASPPGMGVRF